MTKHQKIALATLNNRRAFCMLCIDTVDKVDPADPRRIPALKYYKDQLAEIDAKIAEITGKPPDIVVGLKSAQLFSKAG